MTTPKPNTEFPHLRTTKDGASLNDLPWVRRVLVYNRAMFPLEDYLKSAVTLAQEVVNAWGLQTRAGNANSLTTEFMGIFEKACQYQQVRRSTDFYRDRNALSEADGQAEETARRNFVEAYKPWAETHSA